MQGSFSVDSTVAIAVIVLSTLLNAGYFLPIVYRAFLKKPDGAEQSIHEAPLPMVMALSFTALMTIILFFYPDLALSLLEPWLESLS